MVFYNSNKKVTKMGSKESVKLSWWINSDIIYWRTSPLVQIPLSFILALRSDPWMVSIPRKQGDLQIWKVLMHAVYYLIFLTHKLVIIFLRMYIIFIECVFVCVQVCVCVGGLCASVCDIHGAVRGDQRTTLRSLFHHPTQGQGSNLGH